MISGIEKRISVRIAIDDKYAELFQFIEENRDIFPGFFQFDIENNILPKLRMLEEFEFYRCQEEDSCGAHSPSMTENHITLNI
jgi:hypothetical protein